MAENSFDMKRAGHKADGTRCYCEQVHVTDCQEFIGPSGFCAPHGRTCVPSLNLDGDRGAGVCVLHGEERPCPDCADSIEAIHRIQYCAGHYLKLMQAGGAPDRWVHAAGGKCGVPDCTVLAVKMERPFLTTGLMMGNQPKARARFRDAVEGHG